MGGWQIKVCWLFCILHRSMQTIRPGQVEATNAINSCLGSLYREGLFIPARRGEVIARQGLLFLKLYADLARISFDRRKKRFPLAPKGHYMHHQFLGMLQQAQRSDWCVNILAFAVQMQEDFIGKPSRLARRVSSRTTSLRVLQRTFLAVRNALGADTSKCWASWIQNIFVIKW